MKELKRRKGSSIIGKLSLAITLAFSLIKGVITKTPSIKLLQEKSPIERLLEPEEEIDDDVQEILNRTTVREDGRVIGIDIPEEYPIDTFREMMNGNITIPEVMYDSNANEYNTERLKGPIDFAVIKIGARGYGEKGLFADIGDNYIEYVKICEEAKKPYGFYFYSTALNEEEAQEEINYIKEQCEKIETALGRPMKYNLLGLVLDEEIDGGSRLQGADIEKQTRVCASWIKMAESQISNIARDDVMLYTAYRMFVGEERILDAKKLKELVGRDVEIWITAPYTPGGDRVYDAHQNGINQVISEGGNVVAVQNVLDMHEYNSGININVDVDGFDVKEFERRISRSRGSKSLKEIIGLEGVENEAKEQTGNSNLLIPQEVWPLGALFVFDRLARRRKLKKRKKRLSNGNKPNARKKRQSRNREFRRGYKVNGGGKRPSRKPKTPRGKIDRER